MNDAKTLRDLQLILEAGDLARLWDERTIKAIARLAEGNLRAALRTIRFHFGSDCSPRLFSRAVREKRKRYLDRLQCTAVAPKTVNGKTKLQMGARLFARAGGLCRGKKGFAGMSPETYERVQPLGTAAARQKAAQRRAAGAPLLANSPAGAQVDLAPFWWIDKPAASVPVRNTSDAAARSGEVQVIYPPQ